MSVQAQVEGIGTLEFPDGTDPAVVQATVKKVIAGKGGGAPKDPTVPTVKKVIAGKGGGAPKDPTVHSLTADADIAASLVSGAGASLAGGIVKATGYAREGVEQLFGREDPGNANAAAAKLEDLLTWAPKTEQGKKVMADVQKGLSAFEAWTDKQGDQAHQAIRAAGDKAGEVAKAMGAPQAVVDFIDRHKEQVASAYGAATKTGLNAAPLLAGEVLKLPGKVGEGPKPAAGAPPPGPVPPGTGDLTLAPSAPRAAPGAPGAVTAPPAAPLEAATVPRGTPSTIGEGPLPTPAAPKSPLERAQAYARDRLGLSWDALGEKTQAKLARVAADAQALDRLNPEAVKRQAKLEALRVPIRTTAAKLSRDNAQLLQEQGAAATPSGEPINRIDIEANRDLRRNVEDLVERLRGVGESRAVTTRGEKVGEVVSGKGEAPGALTRLQQAAKARTKAAYEKARTTEPEATVAADSMYEFVRGNPEVLNPQIQHLSWLNNWLKKAGIEKLDEEGKPTGEKRPIKLNELDDLRKKAGKMAGGAGDSAHYAKEVMAAIDQTFEQIPEAASAWKAARAAHKAERGEFKNQGALDRLIGTKGGQFGTDPKTALEDVWKVSVKNARLEEIRQVKRSLLSGRTPEIRLEGKKALRTLRAATAQNLLDEITKGVSTNAAGETNITADSINRWIKGMGQDGTVEGGVEKLNVVLGRKATRELMDIREAAQITKTEPTVRNVGSNTFQKILNWMDESGLGGAVVKSLGGGPLVHVAQKIVKAAEGPATVRKATQDATAAGERATAKLRAKEGELLYNQREAARRKNPPTYGQEP